MPVAREPHRAQAERLDERAAGARFPRIQFALDPPALHDGDPGRHIQHQIEVLLDDEECKAFVFAQPGQRASDFLDQRRLNAFRRFVEKDDPWIGHQRARNREQLLFASREQAAAAVDERHQAGKQGEHAIDRLLLGFIGIAGPREAQVLDRTQARKDAAALRHVGESAAAPGMRRFPRDIDAVHADQSAGRGQQADDGLEQGCLAHAVVADDAERLSFVDSQRDAVQYRHIAVPRAKIVHLEHGPARVDRGIVLHGVGGSVRFHAARFPM